MRKKLSPMRVSLRFTACVPSRSVSSTVARANLFFFLSVGPHDSISAVCRASVLVISCWMVLCRKCSFCFSRVNGRVDGQGCVGH